MGRTEVGGVGVEEEEGSVVGLGRSSFHRWEAGGALQLSTKK